MLFLLPFCYYNLKNNRLDSFLLIVSSDNWSCGWGMAHLAWVPWFNFGFLAGKCYKLKFLLDTFLCIKDILHIQKPNFLTNALPPPLPKKLHRILWELLGLFVFLLDISGCQTPGNEFLKNYYYFRLSYLSWCRILATTLSMCLVKFLCFLYSLPSKILLTMN